MKVVKSFVENESYKHKMAKDVLREWFSGGCGIGDIRFEPNRKCGVWFDVRPSLIYILPFPANNSFSLYIFIFNVARTLKLFSHCRRYFYKPK